MTEAKLRECKVSVFLGLGRSRAIVVFRMAETKHSVNDSFLNEKGSHLLPVSK